LTVHSWIGTVRRGEGMEGQSLGDEEREKDEKGVEGRGLKEVVD
jgi:hypothetical protein